MAAFLPAHEAFFNELINDADSDEDFLGFGDNDVADENDSELEVDSFMDNWQDGDPEAPVLNFQGTPGVKASCQMPDNPQPMDFLQCFIKDEDFDCMAAETNRYAEQFLVAKRQTLKSSSRFHKWIATTASEMRVFLAMVIAMGLVVQMDISEYWSTSEVTATPFFASCMSRDRFWLLMSFFHLADNTDHIM